MEMMLYAQHKADEVCDGLFIGNFKSVEDIKWLQEKDISLIVDAANITNGKSIPNIEIIKIEEEDSLDTNLIQHFDRTILKIKEQSKSTLVICQMGRSRSACLVIAYLMKCKHLSLIDAYSLLKRKRPMINPNLSFILQLICFDYQIKNDIKRAAASAAALLFAPTPASDIQHQMEKTSWDGTSAAAITLVTHYSKILEPEQKTIGNNLTTLVKEVVKF